ncbi:MAG TPA: tetratricopeptide repeat protein [Fibrobacteria bacterium]|nr:tetratricopeptide repeat protein [Fibrobacteria bacterium]
MLLSLSAVPVLAAVAFLVWQNLPEKRFAKHVTKARLYTKENNLTAARLEYEAAYGATGTFTPYASLEVLNLTNRMNLQDKNPAEALNNSRMFAQAHPEIKEGRIILAQLAFQLGETETAFNAINGVLEKDPWYFPARLLLTSVRAKQGRLDLAEEQLRYLYSRYPDSALALLPLAEVLLKQGRSAESRQFLARVLEKNPKNNRARLLMVDSYLKERKVDSAQSTLDAWKESDPEQLQALEIRKARLYSISNKLEEAKAALAPYRESKEANLPALSELAIVHVKGGFYDSAIAVYQAMGEISPAARLGAENMVFYLHMKNRNPARALEALKAIQITDKRPALMAPLVAAYLAIDQENKAVAFIQQQPDSLRQSLNAFKAQLVPDKEFIGQWALISYYGVNHQDYWVYQAVAELYKRWPRSPMAVEMYVSQLSSVGSAAEAAKVLATLENPSLTHKAAMLQLLSSSGQAEKAVALAEKLTAEYPKLQGINVMLADHWIKKDRARAFRYYEKELALNPGNTVVLNNMAWEYGINQANLEKAAPYLDRLRAAKNLDPRILDTIGWILAMNGKYDEGRTYIRNALDLVPDFPAFQYHWAYILAHEGNKEEARKYLDSALGTKLPFEERKEAEKLLAGLG